MKSKNILIVCYYWPPAGGPGVQRWLRMVTYLKKQQLNPIVFVPENPQYPIVDSTLVEKIPKDISVIKNPIKEPYQWAQLLFKNKSKSMSSGLIPEKKSQSFFDKLLLWIRGNFFVPDARVYWVKPSTKKINNLIISNQIDTIITTGPPHSLHLIGMNIKKQHPNIQWLADFRDPWTTIGYQSQLYMSISTLNKHKLLENKVLNQADKIIVTSQVTKNEFETITNKPINVITNGYDEVPDLSDLKLKYQNNKFSLAHIGSWLTDRNPEILWQVLKELCEEDLDFRNLLELRLAGKVSDGIINLINDYHLDSFVVNYGYISHNEALALQRSSNVLMLIEINNESTKCIIPGKLFEYMASGSPIVALGPMGSDVEGIIKTTNTGQYFSYHDKESLKDYIYQLFLDFKNKELKVNAIGLQQYHRANLTKELISFMNQ